jgi:catechol 2,3-dioxygenase-like lactoylglutathione lyase family enzyme
MLHPTLYVPDIPAAVSFYENTLGFLVAFTLGDPPDMAAVNLGDVQMFLEQGTPARSSASMCRCDWRNASRLYARISWRHEPDESSGGDAAPHLRTVRQRHRQSSYHGADSLHPAAQKEARHRLRLARELPLVEK